MDIDKIIDKVTSEVTTDVIRDEMRVKLEEFNKMILRNKLSLDDDMKMVSNYLDQSLYKVRDELLTTVNIHKDELMAKFDSIPEQVSQALPGLVDQSVIDAAFERAKDELIILNQIEEIRLKESLKLSMQECENRIIKTKEEFLDDQIKDVKSKLEVSNI